MSYNDMKEKIEGVEHVRVVAHVGATLAGRCEGDGDALATCKPSTLWGRRAGSV
jgi:hypothetical protein